MGFKELWSDAKSNMKEYYQNTTRKFMNRVQRSKSWKSWEALAAYKTVYEKMRFS